MPMRRPDLERILSAPVRTPSPAAYTRRERRLIARLRTPLQVQRYLRSLPYNWEHTLRSFRGSVAAGRASCLEAVLFTAAILEHHGYPPAVLDIESDDGLDHVLFLYRHDGHWGTVARSRDYGLHGRPPVFRSIPALVRSYMDPYVDGSGRLNAYGVAHLDALTPADWRLSRRSVWRVERALIDMPHVPLLMGERRHQRVLRRFQAFKASALPVNRRTMRTLYGEQVRHWL
ncbi:MAG TPA: hypothetical protein PKC83_09350 [Gemmatimonadaceae bacterium]|nr:hypothetical protein [Gemmatimonadaceae bacterium]